MASETRLPVSLVVEGDVDDAVVRKLAHFSDVPIHEVLVRHGKQEVLRGLPGFNRAARSRPWFVLVDLDLDARCPGEFVRRQLPEPAPHIRFRVAVRSVEAWLLADRPGFARFFGIGVEDIPREPELERDPKGVVIALARGSRKTRVRAGIPPRTGSGRRIGELYQGLLIEFISDAWDIDASRQNAPSLDRAIDRLVSLCVP